jgi:LEA14-like dessication related protein
MVGQRVRSRRFALVALLATGLAACSSLSKLEMPTLTLASVSMTSADIFSQSFAVKVHVANPNDRELKVRGIEYKIFLEGDSFAEGLANKPFTIPALGETDFDMSVRTTFVSSLGRLLQRLNGRTKINYLIEGTVYSDGKGKIPFRDQGSVDFTTMK